MKRRTQVVLLALSAVAVIAFLVFVAASVPTPSTPDFSASSATRQQPKADESLPAAPSDPCHQGGVTYCALNPAVAEATIRSTICVTGWTATIRPPESYTRPLKLQQMAAEGLTGSPSDYEEDHRMPLELGGAPRDPTNLSPESHASSYTKDAAENAAKREVCAGADLRGVQAAFVSAWLGPYPTYRK